MKNLSFERESNIKMNLYGMDSSLEFNLRYFNFMLKEKSFLERKKYFANSIEWMNELNNDFMKGVDILNKYSIDHPYSRWDLDLILRRN